MCYACFVCPTNLEHFLNFFNTRRITLGLFINLFLYFSIILLFIIQLSQKIFILDLHLEKIVKKVYPFMLNGLIGFKMSLPTLHSS